MHDFNRADARNDIRIGPTFRTPRFAERATSTNTATGAAAGSRALSLNSKRRSDAVAVLGRGAGHAGTQHDICIPNGAPTHTAATDSPYYAGAHTTGGRVASLLSEPMCRYPI